MFESLLSCFIQESVSDGTLWCILQSVNIPVENPILYLLTTFLHFMYYTMAISNVQVSKEHFLPSSLLDGFTGKIFWDFWQFCDWKLSIASFFKGSWGIGKVGRRHREADCPRTADTIDNVAPG